jgi:hypothetical protein
MQHALIEREGINKRLQSGSWRTLGQYAVHLTINGFIPEIRRPHPCLHRHAARIHQQRRNIVNSPIAILIDVTLNLAFHQPLQAGIQCRFDLCW